jgi:hypothetical protein
MGYDPVIIETVGVGQDEVEYRNARAHTHGRRQRARAGDEIQAIKAGVLEAGQVFVLNKADRPRPTICVVSSSSCCTCARMASVRRWEPPLLATVATRSEGLEPLADALNAHAAHSAHDRAVHATARCTQAIGSSSLNLRKPAGSACSKPARLDPALANVVDDVRARWRVDPYSAVEMLLDRLAWRPSGSAAMLKLLGFLPRRVDLTRTAFRDYYERQHAPLSAAAPARVSASTSANHLADVALEPGCDTDSEFWYDDAETAAASVPWLASSEGQVLRRDEAQFMDRRAHRCVRGQRAVVARSAARI